MTRADPKQLGRYQILERVGRGGMGVLFRGVDPVLDREVAIKLMLLDFSEDTEQMRPRFYAEARAAAKLQHRNIVTVFEFAEEENTPYIVMEFLRGTSLAARMTSPPPLTVDEKLSIVSQLCDALHYAHEQGVVHRDVKPPNIFLLADESVKLLDFGIAKLTSSTLTRKGDVLGSAAYMSPEQVSGSASVDGRSDIFSTGVMLYELLAGRKPFEAEAPGAIIMKILTEDPPTLTNFVPGLPPQLVNAVNRALAKDPAQRFDTAGDFGKELSWIRKTLQSSDSSVSSMEETRFASATEIRGFQRPGDKTSTSRPAQATPGASTTGTAVATRKWLIPAGVGAVVLVAAVVTFMMAGRSTPEDAAATTLAAGSTAAGAAPGAAAVATPPVALRVDSNPPGAAIMLNGVDTQQTTPATLSVSGAGPHTLGLSKAGFITRELQVESADLSRGTVSSVLDAAPPETAMVSVASTYPIEVLQGSRALSAPAESHRLTVAVGTTLTLRAPDYLFQTSLRVGPKGAQYQAPPLGFLTVLTKFETCSVHVGAKDLGYPPVARLPIASGQYRIDMVCPDGKNPPGQVVTVAPNGAAVARIF